MCGFAGCVDVRSATTGEMLEETAKRMAELLRHRGPDDAGVWVDARAGVAMAHRRLSILDLSDAGHQPMLSASGRFVIVYNGEIYNFNEIREMLVRDYPNTEFRGHSDTEVLLTAVECWGLQATLKLLNGMFAFALWDRREQVLWLARDRFGEKPLYWGWAGHHFVFGSELKALRTHQAFDAELDRNAIADYLRFNCISAPKTIYMQANKLAPASFLCLSRGEIHTEEYWSFGDCIAGAMTNPFCGSPEEACEELDKLLSDAVKMRMCADVPVGAFLSGGIDSSVIVSLMQKHSRQPVQTFSIGFNDPAYDESRDARAVATHLGTDHTELWATWQQAAELIGRLPDIYDEPFADSSQIPTLLVSQLTRRHVSVSLSGDGGDEIFGGYNRHNWGARLWKQMDRAPNFLRRGLGNALRSVSTNSWDRAYGSIEPVLPRAWRQRLPGYKVHKLAGLLGATDANDLYTRMVSHWPQPDSVMKGAVSSTCTHFADGSGCVFADFGQQAMYRDSVTYLPNDILVKLDRATMAFGLEGRVPYLDANVVKFAWSLPQSMKIHEKQGKWILRRVLDRYVPRKLVERPKMGFGIPLDSWLRGPMRDWAESLLDERRLQREGFFEPALIREKWDAHTAGEGSWQYHLWDVLMFEMWFEHQNSVSRTEDRVEAVRIGA